MPLQSMWSNWAGNRALLHTFGQSKFLALHQEDPGDGDTASEVAGNGYHRMRIDWSVPSGKNLANTSTPVFTAMPDCLVLWLAVWTQRSGGKMIAKQRLADPIHILLDGQLRMAKGDVAWSI